MKVNVKSTLVTWTLATQARSSERHINMEVICRQQLTSDKYFTTVHCSHNVFSEIF